MLSVLDRLGLGNKDHPTLRYRTGNESDYTEVIKGT